MNDIAEITALTEAALEAVAEEPKPADPPVPYCSRSGVHVGPSGAAGAEPKPADPPVPYCSRSGVHVGPSGAAVDSDKDGSSSDSSGDPIDYPYIINVMIDDNDDVREIKVTRPWTYGEIIKFLITKKVVSRNHNEDIIELRNVYGFSLKEKDSIDIGVNLLTCVTKRYVAASSSSPLPLDSFAEIEDEWNEEEWEDRPGLTPEE